jgi:ethanolamine utilization protein EutN
MRIARVFGTVTLNRVHPTFVGARLKLAVPLTVANLRGEASETDEELVVWDELGAGNGMLIALSEGAEAAQPFRPEVKPVDAYAAALIDQLDI